jgi:23S rRNA (adenine2503-C2)-methyltransferase
VAPVDLRSLDRPELETFVLGLGEKRFRARQIFGWLHQRWARSFEEMTDLSQALRTLLAREASLVTLQTDLVQRSTDGTVKLRLSAPDGATVESVYMPEDDRRTLCVSTQVGCAMGCTFCRTATMGLVRNLAASEIVEQVHRVNELLIQEGARGPRPLTNLVFMGMGEPLHNFENLKRALAILQDVDGPRFSQRHLTVSTVGLLPMMARLGAETGVKLAVSLNATTDAQRERLMPIARKHKLAELMEACRAFPSTQGRRLTFEYVMLKGLNDSLEDAHRLAKLVKGIESKVNLIAYNASPGLSFEAPDPSRVVEFHQCLVQEGIEAFTRKSRGQDIAAACGQLVAPGRS